MRLGGVRFLAEGKKSEGGRKAPEEDCDSKKPSAVRLEVPRSRRPLDAPLFIYRPLVVSLLGPTILMMEMN